MALLQGIELGYYIVAFILLVLLLSLPSILGSDE